MIRITALLILLFSWPVYGADYYVTQSGTGDGSTVSTPDSIADFNSGVFGALDGDTVHFDGSFSTGINTPDGGTSENRVVLDLVDATFTATQLHQVQVDEDYVTVQGGTLTVADTAWGNTGVYVSGANAKIFNATITGPGVSATYTYNSGIRILDGGSEMEINGCTISQVTNGVWVRPESGGGWAGLITQNTISYCRGNPTNSADGIGIGAGDSTNRDFTGLTISYNNISEWGDDGIDLYYGSNVIVEYNTVGPSTWDSAAVDEGNGIKCGGANGGGSTGNIVRYNTVKNIEHTGGSANNYGITTNYAQQIDILNNVVDAAAYGIIFFGTASDFDVNNNTVVNVTGRAIQVQANVTDLRAYNNILDGDAYDMMTNTGDVITGGANLFVNDSGKSGPGSYTEAITDLAQINPQLDDDYRITNRSLSSGTYIPGSEGYRKPAGVPRIAAGFGPFSAARTIKKFYVPPAETDPHYLYADGASHYLLIDGAGHYLRIDGAE